MTTSSLAVNKTIIKKASKKAKQDNLSVSAVTRILLTDYADGFISIGTRRNDEVSVNKLEVIEVDNNTQKLMDSIGTKWRNKKSI